MRPAGIAFDHDLGLPIAINVFSRHLVQTHAEIVLPVNLFSGGIQNLAPAGRFHLWAGTDIQREAAIEFLVQLALAVEATVGSLGMSRRCLCEASSGQRKNEN